MNRISESHILLTGALYFLPKVGRWLNNTQFDDRNTTLERIASRCVRYANRKCTRLLGEHNWNYLVNVYGDNLWIAMLALATITHNAPRPVTREGQMDRLLSTYLLGFSVFPGIAYGARYFVAKVLPFITDAIVDLVKPRGFGELQRTYS